ncbi:MAG: hypothetical protein GWM92_18845 [Gemmatimonadetes bacterium]|nr:hypothetical protein [Gemmatimonadota bacterium]NIR80860.1 hypothetical protein [Gemmatimonadota bacterium]NIT89679.1 hypothetical protein [Gemmatimonadota bacterium]NIU33459.1 hypothetical protein [Gemmatimonadota bacterium]NIU37745.1 hypothetical protein [Gemmatimonadota bacterium]
MNETLKEARRSLNRLRRAVEKSRRELDGLEATIRAAEGSDFPAADYDRLRERIDEIQEFVEEEIRRLQAKVLRSGGLEPGRIRRTSSP